MAAEAEAAPMALDEPEQPDQEKKSDEATPAQPKKEKKAREATTKHSGKKPGLYDASPVLEGKRERKKVDRLEVVVPVKSPELTVKQVRRKAGAPRRRGRCCALR
jgi:hypothetical protein